MVLKIHPSALVLTGILQGLGAPPVTAQSRASLVPSIDLTTLHDDNVFVTSRAAASDRVVRFTPALSAERTFLRGQYSGSYSIDAERYARHHELTNPAARVQAFSRFHYEAGQRLRLAATHGYMDTTAPTELNLGTAVAAGRMRTIRMSGGSSAAYRLSKRTTATGSVEVTSDRLEDGRTMRTYVARAAVDRAVSRRERIDVDYENSRFDSQSHSTDAHALRLGWTRSLGARTQLQLRGGPRTTAGSASADLFALISHASERTSIALSYEHAQTTVIGLAVPVDAQSIQVRARWSPLQSFSCTAGPGMFRSRFEGRDIDVLRLNLDARYTVTKAITLVAAYGTERQRGAVGAADAGAGADMLRRRTLSIGLTQRWQ